MDSPKCQDTSEALEEFTEFTEAQQIETPHNTLNEEIASSQLQMEQTLLPHSLQSLLQVQGDWLLMKKSLLAASPVEREELLKWITDTVNPFGNLTEEESVSTNTDELAAQDVTIFPTFSTLVTDKEEQNIGEHLDAILQRFIDEQVTVLKDTPQPADSLSIHLASALSTQDTAYQGTEIPKEVGLIKDRISKIPLPLLYGRTKSQESLGGIRASWKELVAAEKATTEWLREWKIKESANAVSEDEYENIPSPRNWQSFEPLETDESTTHMSFTEEGPLETMDAVPSSMHPSDKDEMYDIDLN